MNIAPQRVKPLPLWFPGDWQLQLGAGQLTTPVTHHAPCLDSWLQKPEREA